MENVRWRKSTRSVGNPEQCIELGAAPDRRYVRDSKNQDGLVLTISLAGFCTFIHEIQNTP
jgi:hypothetical protein